MKDILIATSNQHKVHEFRTMLEPLGYNIKSLADLDEKFDINENGKTFEENSTIKAETISKALNIMCLADDSGIEIDAMNKEPGVYSARWLGEDTPYSIKNQEIINRVSKSSIKTCRFVCVIALARPNKQTITFRGTIEGTVSDKIIGENGFGYDPIFYYEPYKTTLGNVSDEMKNKVSHRGKALEKLVEYLNNEKD